MVQTFYTSDKWAWHVVGTRACGGHCVVISFYFIHLFSCLLSDFIILFDLVFAFKNGYCSSLIVTEEISSRFIEMHARLESHHRSVIVLRKYVLTCFKQLNALSSCADETGKVLLRRRASFSNVTMFSN